MGNGIKSTHLVYQGPLGQIFCEEHPSSLPKTVFLEYLEKERGCSGATRNLRLAAIRSLAKFIGMRRPEHLAWSTEIRAVPFKKTPKSTLTYLDKPEIDALLKAHDLRTLQGGAGQTIADAIRESPDHGRRRERGR